MARIRVDILTRLILERANIDIETAVAAMVVDRWGDRVTGGNADHRVPVLRAVRRFGGDILCDAREILVGTETHLFGFTIAGREENSPTIRILNLHLPEAVAAAAGTLRIGDIVGHPALEAVTEARIERIHNGTMGDGTPKVDIDVVPDWRFYRIPNQMDAKPLREA